MVDLDCVRPGSLVASVSWLIQFAQPEGPRLTSPHRIVRLRVDRIFGLSDRNFLRGLHWCQGLFGRDCRQVHHYWHLRERNFSWDRVRKDSWRRTCSFRIQEGERIGGRSFVEDMLSEFVVFECRGVSGI
jgi:hypothetical protein